MVFGNIKNEGFGIFNLEFGTFMLAICTGGVKQLSVHRKVGVILDSPEPAQIALVIIKPLHSSLTVTVLVCWLM